MKIPKSIVVLALVLLPIVAGAGNSGKDTAALSAAQKWLALVDGGDYAQSWEEAAEFFRKSVPREPWKQSLTAGRPGRGVRGHPIPDLV